MLDPRIYRTGWVVAALALVVLAFSLQNQQGPLGSTLAPEVFNGQNVYSAMNRIAARDPDRRPGSNGDDALASQVDQSFIQQFGKPAVTVDTFTGHTVDGSRTLENVVAVRPGMESGSVVIVAHRDALGSPALASLSGTATLLELARDLQGETLNRTVVLASTSGSQGTAGAIQLASSLSGPIDAVIVLGDLASAHVHQPIIVPWSTRQSVAPPRLRNTLAAALGAQASLRAGATGVAGQFAHLAFPFTLSEQAPFGARGVPAILLSLSGDQGPAANAPVTGPPQITALGRAVLQTISALDTGPAVAPGTPYLLLDGKVVPGWAMALFVLALLVPVVLTTVDGLARARRRGHVIWRSLALVLAAAVPFALGAVVVIAARLLGIIAVAPPGPVAAGAVPLDGTSVAVLAVAAGVVIGGLAGVGAMAARMRPAGPEPAARGRDRSSEGAVAALLLVLCVVTIVIWVANPFAAALLVPALHLWLWAVNPDLRLRVPVRLLLVTIGVAPVVLVVLYYAGTFGFSPLQAAWSAALLLAGHSVSLVAALEWSVVLGCLVGVTTIALLAARGSRVEPAPITVRGPITYAGPGSLGGTKSALPRR
jgi:Peptidase family M28